MTRRAATGCALSLLLVALLAARPVPAAEVRVMISAGFFGAYSELAPAFETATGLRLNAIPLWPGERDIVRQFTQMRKACTASQVWM